MAITLGKSALVQLEFLISKETKAECNHIYMLDCGKVNFYELRAMIGKIPWKEIVRGKRVQDGWEFLKKEII